MTDRNWHTFTTTYALIAIAVFGYNAANTHGCTRLDITATEKVTCRAVAGLIAGGLWPLYVSWEAFDRIRGAQ